MADSSRTASTVDRPYLDPYCLSERSPPSRIASHNRGLRSASISFPSLSSIQRGLQDGTAYFLSINTNHALFHSEESTPRFKHALYICSSTPGQRAPKGNYLQYLSRDAVGSGGPFFFETFRGRDKLLLIEGRNRIRRHVDSSCPPRGVDREQFFDYSFGFE